MKTISVNIPFAGFYNSKWSDLVDSEESQWLEYSHDEYNESGELQYPEPLRISEPDLASLIVNVTKYSVAYDAIARAYVEGYDAWLAEQFGINFAAKHMVWSYAEKKKVLYKYRQDTCKMVWDGMTSPREYNFETDRLFVTMPLYILAKIRKAVGETALAAAFKERFTSYDGFISGYRNTIPDKPLAEWDHNEAGTILRAMDFDDWRIYENMSSECGYRAWESAVEWDDFDAAVKEKRQELFAEWLESDPEPARNYLANGGDSFGLECEGMAISYRCQKTPDLFGGVSL